MQYEIATTYDEERFINAYFEAIDFTECGDIDQPEHGTELDPAFERQSIIDCLSFYLRIRCYLSIDDGSKLTPEIEQAGHDFWLTRNGHGAGFWDGDWPTYGDMFTKIAEGYGEAYAIFNQIEG